jgi:ATPase components of various ABC-type transport systems, contain duplicated ATPase
VSSPPFLSLRNIVKRFTKVVGGQTTLITAVDNVNLDIFLGQSVGIIGESGSGKTTLGKIMVKLLDPDGGTISFGQKDITRLKGSGLRDFRASVQMIFQDPYSSLDPKMRVKDLIADFYRLANKKPTRGTRGLRRN